MPHVTPQNRQKDPVALLWIIIGLLSAVATFMGILTLVPKY